MTLETKTCLLCGAEFIQGHAPKSAQVYCSYWCHLKAKAGVLF